MASTWVGGPHPTSGLSGYPARDYGAPGGTPLFGWSTLKVIRISGASGYRGGGFGGYNLYLRDQRGGTYFVTHVENLRVKVGDLIRPAQQIANIGNYGTPHTHIGYTGGDPVNVLGLKPEYLFTPGGAAAGSRVVAAATPKDGRASGSGSSSASGTGGRQPIAFWPSPDIPYVPQFPQDIPGFDKIPGPGALIPGADFITDPFGAFKWGSKNWDRVLEVLGGFSLLLVGLVLIGRAMGVPGLGRIPGASRAAGAIDPVEASYAKGEEDYLRTEARRAGRRAAAARAPSSQTDDIPF